MPANYVLLERVTLTQTATSVIFDNIPLTGYTDLVIKGSARGDIDSGTLYFEFNGATTNLSSTQLWAGASAGAGSNTFTTSIRNWGGQNPSTSLASTFSNFEFYLPNYTSSSNKVSLIHGANENNTTTAYMGLTTGLWTSSAMIDYIKIYQSGSNLQVGSSFSLYGIAATGTTPVIAPKASGGDIVVSDGTYWYHAFLGSGLFTPNQALSCDALVVAGGGGGGGSPSNYGGGGGGGAGGFLAFTSQSLISTTNYTVTVGAGGVSATSETSRGTNGNDSQFGSLTLVKGGGSGGNSGTVTYGSGANGGSGGGAAALQVGGTNLSVGTATSGQGNNGALGVGNNGVSLIAGGGGGGAGAAGSAATGSSTSRVGGAGGAGLNTYSSWASATGTGASGYYAGGGGGSPNGSPDAAGAGGGAGGAGGGGAGAAGGSAAGVSGTANTGGGGGASSTATAGSGGSGIVIVRYTVA